MCSRGNAERRGHERRIEEGQESQPGATRPVINEARDTIILGDLEFTFDREGEQIRTNRLGEDVGLVTCWPEVWESFVNALENLMASGPLLSALRQIDQLAKDSRGKGLTREERALQMQGKVVGIVRQVLDEYERTSPAREDKRHISMLEQSSSGLRGVAPEDVKHALNVEADRLGIEIEPINWQVTEFGEHRTIFIYYHFRNDRGGEGYRAVVYFDGTQMFGGGLHT